MTEVAGSGEARTAAAVDEEPFAGVGVRVRERDIRQVEVLVRIPRIVITRSTPS
jgi:hypothetical protein